MVGQYIVAIPKFSKGKLQIVAKNRKGQSLTSKIEALEDPCSSTPDLLASEGKTDKQSIATVTGKNAGREIKEWQAIMDHLRSLPVKTKGELPVIPVDERAAEVRAIKVG
jgi:5'-nucleotidase/UDP-sugar diphosphatase